MQVWLRKWHRRWGILLAILVILQAGSGALISASYLAPEEASAHGSEGRPQSTAAQSAQGTGRAQDKAHAHGLVEEGFERWMGTLHHGGGAWADLYRLALGIGLLFMAVTGGMIFFKVGAPGRK